MSSSRDEYWNNKVNPDHYVPRRMSPEDKARRDASLREFGVDPDSPEQRERDAAHERHCDEWERQTGLKAPMSGPIP